MFWQTAFTQVPTGWRPEFMRRTLTLAVPILAATVAFVGSLLASGGLRAVPEAWRALVADVRHGLSAEPPAIWWILTALTGGGAGFRFLYLSQPMRGDEAFTYLAFAHMPWYQLVSLYYEPNNHVLHTVLVKLSTLVLGSSPAAIRLPAFIAGVLLVPATYACGKLFYGTASGLIAAALVAVAPSFVMYSTNARGYTMVVLAFLVLLMLAAYVRQASNRAAWALFVLVGTAGFWTVPIMLYPFGAVATWMVWTALARDTPRPWRLLSALSLAVVGTTLLTACLYIPIIVRCGPGCLAANRYVAPSTMHDLLLQLPVSGGEIWWTISKGLGPMLVILLGCGLLVGGIWHARVGRTRVGLLAPIVGWTVALLVVTHRAPPARILLYLLPVLFIVVGAGLSLMGRVTIRRPRLAFPLSATVAVCLGLWIASNVIRYDLVRSDGEGALVTDAPAIAAHLGALLHPGDRVLAAGWSLIPIEYYLWRDGVNLDAIQRDTLRGRGLTYIVAVPEFAPTPQVVCARDHVPPAACESPTLVVRNQGSAVYVLSAPVSVSR
jgi:4-amino-4-deoxy-L-arabinose transferase-like glycosyltransferase